jgi:hypothetical protein
MEINKRDLDNYITGHYGNDQFRDEVDGPKDSDAQLIFTLNGTELIKFRAWEAGHDKTCTFRDDGKPPACPSGAIGGRLTYSFTPTGLGHITVVKCLCGAEVNVTDFDNW